MDNYVSEYVSRLDRAEDKVNFAIGYLEMMIELDGKNLKPRFKSAILELIKCLKKDESPVKDGGKSIMDKQADQQAKKILKSLDPVILGGLLQKARKQCGLTQEGVAKELAIARTTLIAIEAGQRTIRAHEFVELSFLYGVDMSDFMEQTRFAMFSPGVLVDDLDTKLMCIELVLEY